MTKTQENTGLRLSILGCRGSIGVSGPDFFEFGGHTSCYMVEAAGERIFLDAGSGLINAPVALERPATILLSHCHMDHLVGLGMYSPVFASKPQVKLLVPAKSTSEAKACIDRLYSPPLWPITLSDSKGLLVEALPEVFSVGSAVVRTTEGHHPGGCRAFRIEHANKTLVYATDYEHSTDSFVRLTRFCRNANIVLLDAQYADEEYDAHRGYGHSTPKTALELMRLSGAKQLLLIHHDPHSRDETLLARERDLNNPNIRFARDGEVIDL